MRRSLTADIAIYFFIVNLLLLDSLHLIIINAVGILVKKLRHSGEIQLIELHEKVFFIKIFSNCF